MLSSLFSKFRGSYYRKMIQDANRYHQADMLNLDHAFGGHNWATQAKLEHITQQGITLLASNATRSEQFNIALDPPLGKPKHAYKALAHLVTNAKQNLWKIGAL